MEILNQLKEDLKESYIKALIKLNLYLAENDLSERTEKELIKEFNIELNKLSKKKIEKDLEKLKEIYQRLIKALDKVNTAEKFTGLEEEFLLLEIFSKFIKQTLKQQAENNNTTVKKILEDFFETKISSPEEAEILLRKLTALTIKSMEQKRFESKDTQQKLLLFLVFLYKECPDLFEKLIRG
jgi:hypothetical protein